MTNRTAKWVPQNLDDTGIEVYGRPLKDVIVIAFGLIALPSAIVNGALPIPYEFPTTAQTIVPVLGVLIGGVLFWKIPPNKSITEEISKRFSYLITANDMYHTEHTNEDEEPAKQPTTNIWEVDTRTQDLTMLERVHVDHHIAERVDGAYVSVLQATGVGLSLKSTAEKQSTVQSFIDMLNDNDHELQIYLTTRPFDLAEHGEHYTSRQTDNDIQERPILDELTYQYRTSNLKTTTMEGTNTREFYVIIPVTIDDIGTLSTETTWKDRLADYPVLNRVFADNTPTEADKHTEKLEEIQRRTQYVKRNLAGVRGVNVHRVPSNRIATILSEYWTGKTYEHDNTDIEPRDQTVVTRETNTNDN